MSIIKGKTNTVAGVGKDGTGFTLFTPIWQDHLVNNASWLRADTFSWQSGAVYVAAYNHLVNDFNGTTSATETIGSTTITYYRSEDGHKIVLPDHENTVMDIYNATGIAWYYILDTTNNRFKLPRNKYGFTGLRDNVGNYVAPGLPNITGKTGFRDMGTGGAAGATGAFFTSTSVSYVSSNSPGTAPLLGLDASRSSSIYGASDTVQPPAIQTYLYFFVGNTVEEVTTINVGQLTESLNRKADTSLGNTTPSQSFKEMSVGWGMPDYSTGVSITSGWVAPYDCFGYCAGNNSDNVTAYVYVNGVEVFAYTTGAYPKTISGNFLVPKGSTVTFSGTFKTTPKVYKLKGVN